MSLWLLYSSCKSSQFEQMLYIYVNFDFCVMKKLWDLADEKLVNIIGGHCVGINIHVLEDVEVKCPFPINIQILKAFLYLKGHFISRISSSKTLYCLRIQRSQTAIFSISNIESNAFKYIPLGILQTLKIH